MARTNPRMLWQFPPCFPPSSLRAASRNPAPHATRGAGCMIGYLNSERYWLAGFQRFTNAR